MLQQAMEMIRQHTMAADALAGKPLAADAAADRNSPHTSDSEMSAVESLTGMKRGRLAGAHSAAASAAGFSKPATAAFRPRRGLAASSAADLHALNNMSGTTTGSLKTTSSGCALMAALEGAAANAARRSPSQPRGAAEPPRRIDLMRAPGSAESTEGPPAVAAVSAPISTAQQHALVNRILVSMGHLPLSSSTLAMIMAKTGPSAAVKAESPEGSPLGHSYGASGTMLDRSHDRLVAARAADRGRLDLEQDPNQQVRSVPRYGLAAMTTLPSAQYLVLLGKGRSSPSCWYCPARVGVHKQGLDRYTEGQNSVESRLDMCRARPGAERFRGPGGHVRRAVSGG